MSNTDACENQPLKNSTPPAITLLWIEGGRMKKLECDERQRNGCERFHGVLFDLGAIFQKRDGDGEESDGIRERRAVERPSGEPGRSNMPATPHRNGNSLKAISVAPSRLTAAFRGAGTAWRNLIELERLGQQV